jgi:hypothetical protein
MKMETFELDFWLTMNSAFSFLGIDHGQSFPDFAGRPVPLVDTGRPIKEII